MENGRLVYNKEKVNFHLYIKEIIPSLRYIYPSHIININSHETEVPVYIDKLRIEQVITNLLNNACKYSRPNTTINIDFLVNKQHMIQLAVSDEGIGIDEDSLDNIFNKFHREEEVINNYYWFWYRVIYNPKT
jgi:signal transduction histidine kinase